MPLWESVASSRDGALPRVLLIGLTTFLRELLARVIADRAEVVQVERADDAQGRFDAVLVAASRPLDASAVEGLLGRMSALRVIQVSPRGDEAVLYERWPRRLRLGELSSAKLEELLCAPRPDWGRWEEERY